ncbi:MULTISPECIES: methyl-accepting chemotaxis protein [Geobacter]|uniref:Methyl-accepting chemotaxis sensory transducer, class 40+24H n=1 Tax=Geobacter metallireducens (strain ATCC 53774 / DSM 7210 / GS-15) TaxID=269799 RepID=Q39SS1_GEOMG|nr:MULTISPECIES: methyl-accepting chemotaxis protein [Geobacter]ABB32703.1 methyl-accepting chemotaxis sensory transducer, class 40+24H [Geobacter metallireducens GS-15]MBT1076640.1 HAMP domain-containing protein [Geobacter grbiciae]
MLKDMKLGVRLIGSFIIMAVIVAVTGLIGIRSINMVSSRVGTVLQEQYDQQKVALQLQSAERTVRADLLEGLMGHLDEKGMKEHLDSYTKNRDLIRRYSTGLLKGDEALGIHPAPKDSVMESHAETLTETWGEYEKVAEKIIAYKTAVIAGQQTPSTLSESRLISELSGASEFVARDIDDLIETVKGMMKDAGKETSRVKTSVTITFIFVIIGAAALAFSFGIVATRNIIRRVDQMVKAVKGGAEGDLSSRVPITSGDELGRLGDDFNTMLEKLGELVKKVNRSLVEVGQISANIFEVSRRVLSAAEVQAEGGSQTSSAVTEINASIKEVSSGVDSLSLSSSETSSSILEMAASIEEVALNAEALAQSVEEVSSSVVEMVASIKQISGSVASLMEATSSTASSVAEMDSSIKQVEKNAMESAAISEGVRRDAETGKASVEATIAGISEIKRSSRITSEVIETLSERVSDIGAILSVIDEVAEQTNLLALNAAIIAAQAGEHGKGFAVVADEIKELAERTSSSTREISLLIKGVQDETARAVEAIEVAEKSIADGEILSQRSGEALAKIVTGVQETTAQVESIARATMEQAKGSQMIREAMEQVSDMIGQIASATREQSKGSDMIMGAAERMKGLTSQVRVSTKEQAKVGNFIASSTENITTMIRQIKRACDEQTRGSEQIIRAVENIQESTDTNLGAAKMMEDSVSRLSRQLEVLQGEMNSFKVENQGAVPKG